VETHLSACVPPASLTSPQEPTIISPRDYRIRFRRAVLSYFTRVPGSAALADLPLPDDLQD
jgi:hypothetical protein